MRRKDKPSKIRNVDSSKLNPTFSSNARVTVKVYDVLRRAVEEGVGYGYQRAHKYTDTPDEEIVRDRMVEAVMGCICDVFEFPEPGQ